VMMSAIGSAGRHGMSWINAIDRGSWTGSSSRPCRASRSSRRASPRASS
jgi:hypothetical protein